MIQWGVCTRLNQLYSADLSCGLKIAESITTTNITHLAIWKQINCESFNNNKKQSSSSKLISFCRLWCDSLLSFKWRQNAKTICFPVPCVDRRQIKKWMPSSGGPSDLCNSLLATGPQISTRLGARKHQMTHDWWASSVAEIWSWWWSRLSSQAQTNKRKDSNSVRWTWHDSTWLHFTCHFHNSTVFISREKIAQNVFVIGLIPSRPLNKNKRPIFYATKPKNGPSKSLPIFKPLAQLGKQWGATKRLIASFASSFDFITACQVSNWLRFTPRL